MKRALIIDDEQDICFLLSTILKSMGYITDQALTLREGLLKVYEQKPDCVLLDVKLPDGSGVDFIEELKADHSRMKMIIMSAHINESEIPSLLKKGADFFLSKPINREALSAALNV